MKITTHFDSREFAQPARHGFGALRYPPEWIEERLRPLCSILEAIRWLCSNLPITILSGFRGTDYNRAINGARASQHCTGRAADIVVKGMSATRLHAIILAAYRENSLGNDLCQLTGLGLYDGFTHVDIRPGTKLVRWTGSRTAKQTVG